MKKTFSSLIVLLMLTLAASQVFAEERIGSLVFDSIRKLEERNAALLADSKQMREERAKVLREKETARKRYTQARDGSLEQKEAYAEFSYDMARVLKSGFDEMLLLHQASEDHLNTLNSLKGGLQRGSLGVSEKDAKKIIKETDTYLATSDKLLQSIGKYAELITDPVVKQKLASASSTAFILMKSNQKMASSGGKNTQPLITKINQLTSQMEEIYNATDILADILRDKANRLKLANEISAVELATMRLSGGNTVISSISKEVLGPLQKLVDDSDSDMDLIEKGAMGGTREGEPDVDTSWAKGLKNRE